MLDQLARDPSRAALVVDFDGTLAPIVDHPDDARALPAAIDVLTVLVRELALVGIVSGRPVDFLRDRIGIDGVVLVGQYGLERLDGDDVRCDPRAQPFVDAVEVVATEAAARWPRLVVERKGTIAVALHWRTVPDAAPDVSEVEALAARHGLDVLPGRMVLELRPPLPVDKGAAVESLVLDAGVRLAAFAGDDRGDLGAFDALDRLVADARLVAAVRIAVRSDEAPPELLERADVVVDGPADLARLLGTLTGA